MNQLLEKIRNKTARIGIIGMGYVGLPIAVEFARAGFTVRGFDIDQTKIDHLNNGHNYIQDVDDDLLRQLVDQGRLSATADFADLQEIDCISICVPTPLRKTKDPDLSYIISAVDKIKAHLHPDTLIVLESTTYPGTTDELILGALVVDGFEVGKNFFLAFSPERVDPGNPHYKTRNTPKVIGGITPNCTRVATTLYQEVIEQVVPVSSTKTAEMVKLLENTFRAVNIGLVNEMALMCDKLGLNVWEVIEAAATKPFGFMKFYPGPGLGGHCIPIDPHYLSWKLKTLNYNARFIELAGDINSHMPDFVISRLGIALNKFRKPFKDSKILILGMAYKRDVNDPRESPALDVLQLLSNLEADVHFHDPYIPYVMDHGLSLRSVQLKEDIMIPGNFTEKVVTPSEATVLSLASCDAVVLITDHRCYDLARLMELLPSSSVFFDTRNATRDLSRPNIFHL